MPKVLKCKYSLTSNATKRFKRWLLDNDLNIAKFSQKCGVSRQYISAVVNGKIHVTSSVIDTFKKGGYELI